MNQEAGVESYVRNPRLLVDLNKMLEDGILKNGSPRGIWELNEEHK
jgi:hypothetical protein